QVLDLMLGHDVELVGVVRDVVFPTKAECVEQLAARTLHEEQEAHVVEDVERVEIVEIDVLDHAERRRHVGARHQGFFAEGEGGGATRAEGAAETDAEADAEPEAAGPMASSFAMAASVASSISILMAARISSRSCFSLAARFSWSTRTRSVRSTSAKLW